MRQYKQIEQGNAMPSKTSEMKQDMQDGQDEARGCKLKQYEARKPRWNNMKQDEQGDARSIKISNMKQYKQD